MAAAAIRSPLRSATRRRAGGRRSSRTSPQDFPTRETFVAAAALRSRDAPDVVEIGVPFTDPMADGTTIQRSSRAALAQGVSLQVDSCRALRLDARSLRAPLLLMSYLNPLLAYGLDELPEDAARAGVAGFIVPDLPFEECADLRAALAARGLALVQFVTPVTPTERMQMLCDGEQRLRLRSHDDRHDRQERRRAAGSARLFRACETCIAACRCAPASASAAASRSSDSRRTSTASIVGSALVEVLERGEDPAAFLRTLACRSSAVACARKLFSRPVRAIVQVAAAQEQCASLLPLMRGTPCTRDGTGRWLMTMVAGRAASD